ncbi:MAG: LysM peptidoglycan-binding domain-containing protein [Cyclobacteriaceae bacterium]|nr:LysM peptidoglycan-binding domain-containing protein [Cyclobacteriaceae bacterium]
MRFFAVALIFFGTAASQAQSPEVPHKMHFANMTLTIRDDARREIQKDVDGMTRHAKYFNVTAERARLYFPLISKIFAEEGLPDDFKYLSLQESSLVADAVSVSDAVGFWQFKDFTALSVGLRVDREVDERMNIASASRGAALYLKKNNEQFDNWILALQAYQMGAGGVKRSVGEVHNGKRHFEVTSETYWYIKKFLAHKVAFEKAIGKEAAIKANFLQVNKRKSLADIAKEVEVEEQLLKQYNKWALKGFVPDDKVYIVVVPNGKIESSLPVITMSSAKAAKAKPMGKKSAPMSATLETKTINGLTAIKPQVGESIVALSNRAGISLSKLLKYNEIQIDHSLESTQYYFLQKKKTISAVSQHKVAVGDDWWSISQQYGVQVKKLKKWNKEITDQQLKVGSVIWLSANRKAQVPEKQIVFTNQEVIALANETFNWDVKPESGTTIPVSTTPPATDSLPQTSVEQSTVTLPENDSAVVHSVVKGETFYSIAKIYQVSVMDLIEWNKLTAQSKLYTGQKLNLFIPKAAQTVHPETTSTDTLRETYHVVKESDTLYAIARQYGVTIKELMTWNDKKELTVKEGEKLKIRKK